jgi:DNA-binding CsgD family transcriptional regulator
MLVLCTYSLHAARAVDILDVARTHDVSVIRRDGRWEALGPDPRPVGAGDDIVARAFPGRERLTPRELAALAEIVKGASNKEAARTLGISPRTIEFHRTNIMRKLGARNAVELVGIVLGTA